MSLLAQVDSASAAKAASDLVAIDATNPAWKPIALVALGLLAMAGAYIWRLTETEKARMQAIIDAYRSGKGVTRE